MNREALNRAISIAAHAESQAKGLREVLDRIAMPTTFDPIGAVDVVCNGMRERAMDVACSSVDGVLERVDFAKSVHAVTLEKALIAICCAAADAVDKLNLISAAAQAVIASNISTPDPENVH